MKISPARVAAFEILKRIELENAFSSPLLASAEAELSQLDRNLCHQLVLGVLRKQMYLDRLITALAGTKKIDLAVRLALRLGLYQLLFLDKIPDFSAINESVNLVVRAKKVSAKGFVNAVLRRAIRGDYKLEYTDAIDRISTESSHPRWLIERWTSEFGSEAAEAIAQANNEQPKISFRYLKGSETPVLSSDPSQFVEGCYVLDRPNVDYMRLADEGMIYLQDEGSQMIAKAVEPAHRIFDVCAAPGGKTGLIAVTNDFSRIFAGDVRTSRVTYLKANCENQGVHVPIVQYDAAKRLPFATNTFGSVFVDAPCSGTGTIRHNPELRYLIKEADIAELQNKQLAILHNASDVVDSGGTLLYSTCSLEREENEGVCARFLAEHPEFTPVVPRVPGMFLTPDGTARTWPHRHQMDGFFLAAFRKA